MCATNFISNLYKSCLDISLKTSNVLTVVLGEMSKGHKSQFDTSSEDHCSQHTISRQLNGGATDIAIRLFD